jgi:transcriptional regulator with XRE-family HTH domain
MLAENLFYLIPSTAPVLTTSAKQLLESWKDPEYRSQFVRERAQSSVALQIRALRDQRDGMTQAQLGERMGKAQPWISQLENPEYGKMSVTTLLDLAEAFDTDLEIKFRSFSRALYELTKQGSEYFEVRSFEEELPELEAATSFRRATGAGRWSDMTRAAFLLAPPRGALLDVRAPSISGAICRELPRVPAGSYRNPMMETGIHLMVDDEDNGRRKGRRPRKLINRHTRHA